MLKTILSSVLCFAPFFMSPDAGAGSGGGGSDPAPAPPTPEPVPPEPPAPEGTTLEAKLLSATNSIKTIFGSLKDAIGKLNDAQGKAFQAKTDLNTEQAAHTATKGLLATEQAAHTTTKGELSTAKTTITGLTAERDTARTTATRLEKLCDLRGIDHKEVVGASTNTGSGSGDLQQQYRDILAQEKEGKVPHGTASKFYHKNKAKIDG